MSASPQSPSSAAAPASAEPPFAQTVLRTITWQKLLVAQAFGMVLALLNYLQVQGPGATTHALASQLIMASVGALFFLVVAVATDEAVRRGVRVSRVLPLALLVASGAVAVTQWYLRSWLGVLDFEPDSGPPLARIGGVAIYIGTSGGLAAMVYLQRQDAQRVLAGIRAAELQRVQDERHLIESRLAATQAQIDPSAVFRELAVIRDCYAAARPGAETKLEALIQELRGCVMRSAVTAPVRESRP
jgi:hypothetical protein